MEDELLFCGSSEAGIVVKERVSHPYAMWGITPRVNKGIEGLTVTERFIVGANENVMEDGGQRWAPVARYDRKDGQWTAFRVALTSSTGRLSAISCKGEHELNCRAVERHYGVSRVIAFTLPEAPGEGIGSRCLFDLAPHLESSTNVEGLFWMDDDAMVLISDNHSGTLSGPTRVIVLR